MNVCMERVARLRSRWLLRANGRVTVNIGQSSNSRGVLLPNMTSILLIIWVFCQLFDNFANYLSILLKQQGCSFSTFCQLFLPAGSAAGSAADQTGNYKTRFFSRTTWARWEAFPPVCNHSTSSWWAASSSQTMQCTASRLCTDCATASSLQTMYRLYYSFQLSDYVQFIYLAWLLQPRLCKILRPKLNWMKVMLNN